MQFYKGYKNKITCRGEGPIKIRFRHLPDKKSQFNSHPNKNNFKYLIDDAGLGYIYHYDNFFEWKEGKRGCEKLTGISPRMVGQYFKDEIDFNLDIEKNISELINFFKEVGFTKEMFEGRQTVRLKQLKYLIKNKRIFDNY